MTVRDALVGRTRRGVLLRLLVILAVLALLLTYAAWPRSTPFSRAAELLPKATQRVLWTDWAGIRAAGDCSAWPACEGGLAEKDLDSSSVLITSADALQQHFHWGPQTIGTELLGQAADGQVLVIGGLSRGRLASIARAYEDAGFTPPKDHRTDGGVWEGGPDLLSELDIQEPLFGEVAFLPDRGVLLTSDSAAYLKAAVKTARAGDGLDVSLVRQLGAPLAAVALAGDRACAELSFATADTDAQTQATQLVADAGGVTPLAGYAVGLGPDRAWTAAFAFESADRARHDLLPRQRLAAADDPGQMVDYPDLFTVDDARRDGSEVVLTGHARPSAYALSQVTQGPVLLASC